MIDNVYKGALYIGLIGFFCSFVYTAIAAGRHRNRRDVRLAYDFSFTHLDGTPLPLSAYQGKVVLVVNTASQCGFTPQYKELEELYTRFKDRGLVVLGVPSNDFGKQEPGDAKDIQCFLEDHYPVTFPVAQKVVVKGHDAHPFYQWVGRKAGFLQDLAINCW